MKRKLAVGAGLALGMAMIGGTPALAADGESTVAVLHGIPGVTVDVYVNGEEAISDFEPGTLTDPMMLAAGSYDIQVFADGGAPGSAEPAVEASDVAVPAGANITIAAHLTAAGEPALTPFVNETDPVAAGEARLTVRHLAAAPEVDVRAGGAPIAEGLANGDEATLETSPGTVSADVVLAGTSDVAIGPADLTLAEGATTIVTAWGSAEDGTLALAVQSIDLHSAPGGVPSGLGGAQQSSIVAAMAAFGGALALGAVWLRQRRTAEERS